MYIKARLKALERERARAAKEPMRCVIAGVVGETHLENCTCVRHMANGRLSEVITLDGSMDGLTNEDLDRFVERFPIEYR